MSYSLGLTEATAAAPFRAWTAPDSELWRGGGYGTSLLCMNVVRRPPLCKTCMPQPSSRLARLPQPCMSASVSANDLSVVARGGLFVCEEWVSAELIGGLRSEVSFLEASGEFVPSGVAIGGSDGTYGAADRRVCVLPIAPAVGAPPTCVPAAGTPAASAPSAPVGAARAVVLRRLDNVCASLARTLRRPTLHLGECYFSLSAAGARLPRHDAGARHGARAAEGEAR